MNSSGGAFPRNGINPGHVHYLTVSGHFGGVAGGQYVYLGGTITGIGQWRLMGGVLNTAPDTSSWGAGQAGAFWFNNLTGQFVGWNGSQEVILG